MMPMPSFRLILLLFTALLIPSISVALQPGEAFPAFTGKTLDGGEFELANLKGKPVLIKIGTTWCGTCQEQAKAINNIGDFLQDNGVQFVDVFIQENAEKVRSYLGKVRRQLPETVILDDGDIAKRLNVYVIPRVILLNKDLLVFRDGTAISEISLKEQLQELVGAN